MKKLFLFSTMLTFTCGGFCADDTTVPKSDYITAQVTVVTQFLQNYQSFKTLRKQWDALGYGTTLKDSDFSGSNIHLSSTTLTAIIVSEQAITDLMEAGGNAHLSNLYKAVR
jgi:hypothetical protein